MGPEPDKALVQALRTARRVAIRPGLGKVGDTLLFLAAPLACLDWLRLARPHDPPEIVVATRERELFEACLWGGQCVERVDAEDPRGTDADLVVMDGRLLETTRDRLLYGPKGYSHPRFVEETPLGARVHSSWPSRFYLAFERDAGLALGRGLDRCLPTFRFDGPSRVSDPVRVAVVATSGWPLKQYGVHRYLDAVGRLARLYRHRRFEAFVVASPAGEEIDAAAEEAMGRFPGPVEVARDADLGALARLLSGCDAAMGNDTGLSHLAAMTVSRRTRRLLPTVMVHLRMDPSVWTVGGPNVRVLTGPFARMLAARAAPVHLAHAHPAAWGRHARPGAVPESSVTNALLWALLGEGLL